MHYLMMCCFDEDAWEKLPESQRGRIMADYGRWQQDLVASGRYATGAKLTGAGAATTVRAAAITDGPFAETKEQLGGYHLVDCRDLDEALAIARRIPTLPHGGAVEVRPVQDLLPGCAAAALPVAGA